MHSTQTRDLQQWATPHPNTSRSHSVVFMKTRVFSEIHGGREYLFSGRMKICPTMLEKPGKISIQQVALGKKQAIVKTCNKFILSPGSASQLRHVMLKM